MTYKNLPFRGKSKGGSRFQRVISLFLLAATIALKNRILECTDSSNSVVFVLFPSFNRFQASLPFFWISAFVLFPWAAAKLFMNSAYSFDKLMLAIKSVRRDEEGQISKPTFVNDRSTMKSSSSKQQQISHNQDDV